MPNESPPPPDTKTPRQAGILQVAGAVFWSFFGIRKGKAMARDAVTIKPQHVIIVGIVAAMLFVATLLVVVRLIINYASG